LIVLCDRLRDSKQCRLIAKVLFPRALLFPNLATLLLTSVHGNKKSDVEPDDCAKSERQADSTDYKNFFRHVVP